MRPAIKVQDVTKRYQIGLLTGRRTLREAIMENAVAPLQKIAFWAKGRASESPLRRRTDLLALHNISFDVMPGEVLGLIGQNGAGKSTLLRVLSRITEPTAGRIELGGRVGSLLEVGTGFSGELTGRENIFLSGSILGMRRVEVQRQFDQIVAFAGVEDFIDTPVKRYSSGMHVRLGFAVAAHLEAEILLVDEVLAVGDLAFQRKCIGKMSDIARGGGRTIIFVSHNMASIESLCSSCLLLDKGELITKAAAQEAIAQYVSAQALSISGTRSLVSHPGRRLGWQTSMELVELYCGNTPSNGVVRMGSALSIVVSYSHHSPVRPVLGVAVKTMVGAPVFYVGDRYSGQLADCTPRRRGRVICTIDELRLMPGSYTIDLYLGEVGEDFDIIVDAIYFEVIAADLNRTGRLPPSSLGPTYCPATFNLAPHNTDASNQIELSDSGHDSTDNAFPAGALYRI